MRPITSTLLAAQKAANRKPFVRVTASNMVGGVVNLRWERLYTGEEEDGPHALTLAGNGAMVRVRITAVGDNRKLYRQTVALPDPESDYSQWTYLNQYNVVNCAACSLGDEVSLFWIKNDGEIDCIKSLDNGESWLGVEYLGYSPTGAVSGLAAAYKANGDLALFFTDGATLYIIRRAGGEWQDRVAWDKETGDLTGVAAVYDGDFKLLACGKDGKGNFKVWSLVYGDGAEGPEGVWSDLKELSSAPADSNYEFGSLFLDGESNICRCFYTEKFTGDEAYCRPFGSYTLPGTSFLDNRWREPVPFGAGSLESGVGSYGLAMAHDSDYVWLSMPSGIWRAKRKVETLDLSEDVTAVSLKLKPDGGELIVELRNEQGQYNDEAGGFETRPYTGCQIDFAPGYRTREGNEISSGLSFWLQAYEHLNSPGKSSLMLYAEDGWLALVNWTARTQLRWNAPDEFGSPTTEASVKEILAQIMARCGITFEAISESAPASEFYPDFMIHAGDNGHNTVNRLLSFIPDVIFIEGNRAYLINPLATDPSIYSYGTDHVIQEGKYRASAWKVNWIKAEGSGVAADSLAWSEIQKGSDILQVVNDLNIDSVDKARERGRAILRKIEMESISGLIRVPVNCGQQLYDVIAVTDVCAGLDEAKRRILGINLSYLPFKAQYEQELLMGGV